MSSDSRPVESPLHEFPSFEQASRKLATLHAEQKDTIAELQNMLRQRDDFLANISHQLRTPLTSILGYGELLQQGTPSPVLQEDYLAALQEAAKTMLSILSDMPKLASSNPATWIPQTKPANLAVLVPQLEGFFAYEAQKKNLDFTITWDNTIPDSLLVDISRIRQVLLIIVHNAIRFTETGHVSVNFSLQNITGQRANVRFTVQDSGIGMSRERIDGLFNSPLGYKKFGRAGSNLLMAKQGVEWLGAQLHIESEPGKGSRFSFLLELPLAPQETKIHTVHETPVVSKPTKESWKTAKILVADDHAMNRELLKVMLERLGIGKVDMVSNGLEAIAKCKEEKYDLFLADCHMPDMDGFDATRQLKIQQETRDMPIIGITADVLKVDKAQCMAAGMEDAFNKPVPLSTLEEILHRWLK